MQITINVIAVKLLKVLAHYENTCNGTLSPFIDSSNR